MFSFVKYKKMQSTPKQKPLRVMISGSLSFTQTEFQTSYKPEIDSILQQHKDATFIVGDAAGADTLALNYLLKEAKIPSGSIVVCPSKPKRDHLKKLGVTIVDGFTHYSKRDEYMTENSDVDIAFIRGDIYSLGGGTMKNLMRRKYGNSVSSKFMKYVRDLKDDSGDHLSILQNFKDQCFSINVQQVSELIEKHSLPIVEEKVDLTKATASTIEPTTKKRKPVTASGIKKTTNNLSSSKKM